METPAPISPEITPQPISPEVPAPQPIVAEPITTAPEVKEGFFSNKLEITQIIIASTLMAFMVMGILKYRKDIQTSNNYQNLQNQLDQLKLKINAGTQPQRQRL